MKSILIATCAALALVAAHPADAGSRGKDRGSQVGGKPNGREYGKRDHGKDRGRHGHGKHGHGKHGGGYGRDYCPPETTPEPPAPEPPAPEPPQSSPSPRPDRPSAQPAQTAAPEREYDSESGWLNQFGGALSGDPVTSKMVSDYVRGARRMEHIVVDRSGAVIALRPAPEAEALSWWQTPTANW